MENSNKKVLVVEDDGAMRNVLRDEIIKKYPVILAEDGEQAMQKIEADHPDLVVLDLLLPKVDGFEVLARLRSLPDPKSAKIPVIVVSNMADPESIHRAKSFGIEEYFIKSDIRMGILANRVHRVFVQGQYGATMRG